MPFRWDPQEHIKIAVYFIKWLIITIPLAVAVGSANALFLWLLDKATEIRTENPDLLFLLPIAGIFITFLYRYAGGRSEAGNNLIMDEIHEPGGGVPLRMAPLILFTTVTTHLFGGSAGREGTAIQIGGSIAGGYQRIFPFLDKTDRKKLLMVGMAAGFGGVFGTPLAGAIFAIEVLSIGRIEYEAILPAFMGAIISDAVVRMWGIHHTPYEMIGSGPVMHMEILLLAKVIAASVIFGLVSMFFAELTHSLHRIFRKLISVFWLRPVAGGILIIILTFAVGTRSYNGLGVSSSNPAEVTILSAFNEGGAEPLSWLWKTIFTSVTISSGFKGGEVTPLFYIGATLGNTLASLMDAPVPLFAALGLVAVFSGAANTPLASAIMGIELFGSTYSLYITAACYTAFFFSGHSGIYLSQRIGIPKGFANTGIQESTLRMIRELKPGAGWKINNKK